MTQQSVTTFDPQSCHLGEGYLWHPTRNQLFWFDINNKQILSRKDTPTGIIIRQPLDDKGWPKVSATPFIDLSGEGLNPDGAVVDAHGHVWNTQWGAS